MLRLEGKTAVVTGGGSGIGLAIARRFAAEGASVYIMGRRQAQLDQAVALLGARAHAVAGDVTVAGDLERLFATVREEASQLDILVTSSGVSDYATLDGTTGKHFDDAFNLNVRAMVFTVQHAARQMASGGSIVLIGSIAGSIGNPGYGTYSATKAAVRSYARTWSHELAPRGIRVNALSPGPTDTPMFDGVSDVIRQSLTDRIPMKRLGTAEKLWLCHFKRWERSDVADV